MARADAEETSLEGFNPRSLSVVVPTYNEEANAVPLVRGLVGVLQGMEFPFELIVVDDGSRDATVAQLRSLLPTTPELVIVRLRRNFGQTSALQAGFDRARGDVVVTLDGDLQNDPRDIPRLLERIRLGADVVSGWRVDRKDGLWLRRVPSQLANGLIRRLTGVPIHDQGCSLKAYRREVVRRLRLYSDMHRFIGVLVMPTGAAIDEIAVAHHPRIAGVSKYGLSRIFKVISDLLTIQMLTRFRENPMRWFALFAAPFLIGAIASGAVAIWKWGGSLVPATVSLTLAFTCVSCLLAGMFGETIVGNSGHLSNRRMLFRGMGEPAVTAPRKLDISVLVPVVERHDNLVELHHSVLPEIQKLGDFEVLYLISAEFEHAIEQALELHDKDPGHVRVLRFARPVGEAAALATGFDRARGEVAITIPSYFDASPAGLGALLAVLEDGADMAFAVRTGRSDGLVKQLQTTLFSRLASWATGTHFDDVASATRALRREIVRDLPLYGDFHRFLPVLAHGAGFRVVQVPVAQDARSRAPHVYRLRVYLYRALDILSMFFLSHFTRRPLRLFGAAGTLFGALGALILLVTGVQRLLGTPLADRPILILGTLLLGLGVQAFTIGSVGRAVALLPGPRRTRLPHCGDLRVGAPSAPRADVRRRVRVNAPRPAQLALVVALVLILGATLVPAATFGEVPAPGPRLNWSFPLADVIRNWLLFVPFGAALRACGMRGGRALAVGTGLSLGIEILQLGIPGRETALSDLVTNSLGTGTGIALVRTAPAWFWARGRRARRIALAAAAGAVLVMAATGWLLTPVPATAPLYAHLAPQMPNLRPYGGRVLEADLDGEPLPYGELADSERIVALLRGDYALRVIAEAARPADGLAALLLVTDEEQREILLLGPDAEDLVLRYRSRGARFGLERARIRVAGALRGLSDGERFRAVAERAGADFCLGLDGSRHCGLGFTLGDGWSLLIWDQPGLARHRQQLGTIWLGMLLLPLGFWGKPSGSIGVAWAAVLATLLLAPSATGLLPTPLAQFAGAIGGVAAGRCLRWGLRSTIGPEFP